MSEPVLDAFRFTDMAMPGSQSRLGLMSCPGYREAAAPTGRYLRQDIDVLVDRGVRFILNCVPLREMPVAPDRYSDALKEAGILWASFPIPDMTAPDDGMSHQLSVHLSMMRDMVEAGQKPAIHCLHGLGRTGTLAALLLVSVGLRPANAIQYVRDNHDRRAIETEGQERFIENFRSPAPFRAWRAASTA